jgi:tetratricopeptide (TPR) repeat protein
MSATSTWTRAAAAAACLAAVVACKQLGLGGEEKPSGAPSAAPSEVGALIDQGRLDEALAKVEGGQDGESLYWQGKVWAKKAETAPLPTPPPVANPLPRGASLPPAPEFKNEEKQAIALFERSIAADPGSARPHVALAELLAPHALRRASVRNAAAETGRGRRGRRAPAPVAEPLGDTGGVDASVDRVIRAYQFALQADPASPTLPAALAGFGLQAGRVDAAEIGYQEQLKRQREKPEPFIQYGDFLANHKHDQMAAIEQYRQALIWRSDDDATRGKIAEIYLARGAERFNQQQFAGAEQEFNQAAKWITDRTSPQAQRLNGYLERMREIRIR